MADDTAVPVTLETLHGDLGGLRQDVGGLRQDVQGVQHGLQALQQEVRAGFHDARADSAELRAEIRAGFSDLKATLITGFRNLPSRESSEEMVRLLREGNRLQDERFTQLGLRIREQHLETQQVLHAVVEGQRALADAVRGLAGEIRALVVRIDALIRGRGNGQQPA